MFQGKMMKLNKKALLSLTLIGGAIYPHVLVADPYIYGTPGKDYLRPESDTLGIYAYQGDDTVVIFAHDRAGPVLVSGGDGFDQILALNSARNDLRGGNGDDFITGGSGGDKISGGLGDDKLYGSSGEDNIEGNQGNDTIFGGSGYDVLEGNSGNDKMYGGQDGDFMYGGTGNDWMEAGSGWDDMFGERGNDTLIGGGSDDYGTDNADGGDGIDECREIETAINCES